MESSSLNQQNQWSCPSSDSEFYSISSPEMISPTPSTDQGFSPSHRAQPTCSKSAKPPASPSRTNRRTRRLRLKNPSEQRQNASEKEKLRMRDLTKALHHLRTYLPASVAPVGQTLTKIETLRLTIRYISFLSSQLGLSEEELTQRKHISSRNDFQYSPEIVDYLNCRSTMSQAGTIFGAGIQWAEHRQGHYSGQYQSVDNSSHTEQRVEMNVGQYISYQQQHSAEQNLSPNIDSFLQPQHCAQTTQSYQVYSRNLGYQLVPQAYWS